jgi:hypothetical protein
LKNESQIKGLPNIKSIDGMVYDNIVIFGYLWVINYGFLAIIYWKNPFKWKGVDIPGC